MSKVELIPIKEDNEIIGYETSNVTVYMESIGKLEAWEKWFQGQTGAIIDGKFVVYASDVERFLKGLPDADLL